jgi:Flp pilus assembly protein TadB
MENKTTSTGVSFSSLLLLAFIVLKLCKVINWSWWWVLSPIWIGASILLIILAAMGVWYLVQLNRIKKKRKQKLNEKSKWQQRIDEINALKTAEK